MLINVMGPRNEVKVMEGLGMVMGCRRSLFSEDERMVLRVLTIGMGKCLTQRFSLIDVVREY
jgi:hypothetical protein